MPVILDAFSSGGRSRAQSGAGDRNDNGDWHQPEQAKRDPKRFFLVLGLGVLSWVATYVGMLELICRWRVVRDHSRRGDGALHTITQHRTSLRCR